MPAVLDRDRQPEQRLKNATATTTPRRARD
jgi:hypothetical protein